jgi:hypothetical protein
MQSLLHQEDSSDIDNCGECNTRNLEKPNSMQLYSITLTSVNRFMN